jgi:hypothetical protein
VTLKTLTLAQDGLGAIKVLAKLSAVRNVDRLVPIVGTLLAS